MTALKYKDGGTWHTLTMPSAVHIGTTAPDPLVKQIWADTDEGYAPSNYIAPLVSVLPSVPFDGQEVRYQSAAMATAGVVWTLRYRAASLSAYKWEFVGGSGLFAYADAQGTFTPVSTWVDPMTLGSQPHSCNLTLPLAGDYDIEVGARMTGQAASQGINFSYMIGAATPQDVDGVWAFVVTAGFARPIDSVAKIRRKTGMVAGVVLAGRYYQTAAGTATAGDPWMRATPVRVA